MLTIQPYDKSSIKAIEKSILESDVGLTPSNDGAMIRLIVPELNEERRKQLVKVVRASPRRAGWRSAPSAATR
jgi:ribosome recycling factor